MDTLDGRGRGRGRAHFADAIFLCALFAISLRTAYGDKLGAEGVRGHMHVRFEAIGTGDSILDARRHLDALNCTQAPAKDLADFKPGKFAGDANQVWVARVCTCWV